MHAHTLQGTRKFAAASVCRDVPQRCSRHQEQTWRRREPHGLHSAAEVLEKEVPGDRAIVTHVDDAFCACSASRAGSSNTLADRE